MANHLTIVMYHYVRPLRGSRYPDLKALDLDHFRGQLDFIQRHYQVVSMQEVIAATRGDVVLPDNSLLLTFDDGYLDHYAYVLPQLASRGWQGSFFPPVRAVREGRVLDVNKIHFTLASGAHPERLIEKIYAELDAHRADHDLPSNEEYFEAYSREGRYDDPRVTFIKRLLQKGLPKTLREPIIDKLFREFVTGDERDFAAELYLNEEQLREMYAAGMCIGSHGDEHLWLNTLPDGEQHDEINASLAFLAGLGVSTRDWVMCYPFGGYDERLLDLLREKGCSLGLTVDVGIADLTQHEPLTLPRLDTNDLPTDGNAPCKNWKASTI
ncbi:polysaccharide deacetylase family protein [Halomonas organivorans]|uniref:Peptidoglycan/xylan/chitin deacetylase (PgdA/CDA1 family) n=1 Tax=Halomonas organivorans TaxID=257772 RepID=A0A7W5G4K0_9GAMM|nr:polysaccharide deacetylase family protein [Halomonas organivorans]MBB3140060.1 peptidoglycan/xylan/chitin deacetylase (PgdA/CDA1 family) [Halomonas organivorans]